MKFLITIFLTITCASVLAQTTKRADEDWGLRQRLTERAAYWRAIEMSGTDTNIPEAKLRGYKQFTAIPRSKRMMIQSVNSWEQVAGSQAYSRNGTGSVSGRPSCIAFDPSNPNYLYMGASGGGLWKTTDAGKTWVSLSDSWSSYAMGGVAVDPNNRLIIYAATGDMYDQVGDGLYKSEDGGINWTHPADASVIGYQCNQVVVDPSNSSVVYITGTDGMRKSTDAGMTWKQNLQLDGVTHMVLDPSNTQTIIAGGGGQIVRSTDAGENWSSDVAANISGKNTVTLAISKKDPTRVYASIADGSTGGSLGLGRSDDNGKTWAIIWNHENYMSNQGWYDNACAVNPNNANNVVMGGLDIYGTGNGGTTVTRYTSWGEASNLSSFTHADIHVLAFNPYSPGSLYALTDGGIFFSNSNGLSWQQSKNDGLATLLFVGGDAAPDFSFVLGGCQDNGINHAYANDRTFVQTYGGDGGNCSISQEDGGQIAYSTYINADLHKSTTGGFAWDIDNVIPANSALASEGAPFYMKFDVAESDANAVAIAGYYYVHYSTDGVNSLSKISTIQMFPSALHVAAADPAVVYVGAGYQSAASGYIYVTKNASDLTAAKWTKSTTKTGIASSIVADPNNAAIAYASVQGYGVKHFWKTTDYGKTWVAPKNNLPDLNATAIAVAPNGDLFLGHSYGVMRSIDQGASWEPLRDGIPLCSITKLRVRGKNHEYLLATTYGRGMYRINIANLPRTVGVTPSAPTTGERPRIVHISPNPAIAHSSKVSINYSLPTEGPTTIVLFDEIGHELKTLMKDVSPAEFGSTEADISELPSGSYYVVLTASGYAVTEKFVVTK
ncbi:MAG: T9SS type A sorting domain-containing protein [bacterium]